jgi:hypothetical protein
MAAGNRKSGTQMDAERRYCVAQACTAKLAVMAHEPVT